MECIILAGGLGTRLRDTIGDLPKCMADVNGKPFLQYLLNYLAKEKCIRVILSLGYMHEVILDWLKTRQYPFEITYVLENTPLGTGGGIQLAMQAAKEQHVVVLNGDTMFSVDLEAQMNFHTANDAETTLALKKMFGFSRYGVVNKGEDGKIISFEEKQQRDEGFINGGIYCINRTLFLNRQLPEKFSFEKEYLEACVGEGKFYGFVSDSYFIDIGIPEDYAKAQHDLK